MELFVCQIQIFIQEILRSHSYEKNNLSVNTGYKIKPYFMHLKILTAKGQMNNC